MKCVPKIFLPLAAVCALTLVGCAKSTAEPGAGEKNEAPAKPGVMIDPETQARIGLILEPPKAAQWLPVVHAVGHVIDPLAFTTAVADLETARAASVVSHRDLERMQKLASQDNASARALEAAQAAAARDAQALKSAQARFSGDWGAKLATNISLAAFVEKLSTGDFSLLKISMPVGAFPDPLPSLATIFIENNGSQKIAPGELVDDLRIDVATQVQSLLFSVSHKLPANVAVTAQLKTSGAPAGGVMIPPSAVLRYEGKGWVYLQAETNRFVRVEIPLTSLTDDGWFVPEGLSATNRLVTTGAETVLSAEQAGGFSTGGRD